jgi:small GTP-binding protein
MPAANEDRWDRSLPAPEADRGPTQADRGHGAGSADEPGPPAAAAADAAADTAADAAADTEADTEAERIVPATSRPDPVATATAEARAALAAERTLLRDLQALLARADVRGQPEAALRDAADDLDGLFLLVVVGEFNAGKSSLINALLSADVMREGVTPTTDRVTLVQHGETARFEERSADLASAMHPAERLLDLVLVDTPGTNAVIARHQELTERFVPRADLVLFVTSADRPFTQSERAFLELIESWGKPVTVIVNKADLLRTAIEIDEVVGYVRRNARETLGTTPPVFPVSSREARAAQQAQDEQALAATGLPALEQHLAETLDTSRLRLKLGNPLGVARHVAQQMSRSLDEQHGLLLDDRRTLDEVDRQQALWRKDLRREGQAYLDRVTTVLLEVERRGEAFFDDTVRLSKLLTLMRPEQVRAAFEERVLRDAERRIEEAVAAMVDWLVERTLQQWEDVVLFVNERRRAGEERVIGEVGGRFQYDRKALIRSLRDRAETVLERFDREAEGRRLAEALKASVVQTGLIEIGGVGLGAAAVAIVTTTAWDVTGIAAGLTVMGLGLLVLPRRRAQAKRRLHVQMSSLRDGLEAGLGSQLEEEGARASERLGRAIEPYTRFVRSELERLEQLQAELEAWLEREAEVRSQVERL